MSKPSHEKVVVRVERSRVAGIGLTDMTHCQYPTAGLTAGARLMSSSDLINAPAMNLCITSRTSHRTKTRHGPSSPKPRRSS